MSCSLTLALRKPWAFIKKDFISATSYKLSFLMELLGIFFSVAAFYFLSKLFGQQFIPHLRPYGGNYFAFVIIGVAFFDYLNIALRSLAGTIRGAQVLGTFEALLATQTEVPTIIFSSSLYNFIWTTVRVVAYLAVGVVAFDLDISAANYSAALVILVMTVVAFSSLGIISASFIMVLKRGDPINWLLVNLSGLLGGLYYPVSVLPGWLQKLAYLLPVTYALEGMRLALLQGQGLRDLWPIVAVLLIFSLTMLPVSVLCFKYAIRRAKRDGSLTQF